MVEKAIPTLLLFNLLATSIGCKLGVDPVPEPIWVPNIQKTHSDWDQDKAIIEAQKDIESGKIKIYYAGTIVSLPVGIDDQHLGIISRIPRSNAGIGCTSDDWEFRRKQFEYALKYNSIIINHIKSKQ